LRVLSQFRCGAQFCCRLGAVTAEQQISRFTGAGYVLLHEFSQLESQIGHLGQRRPPYSLNK
jgi:hypothetical protein